jgi:hypothetical protein
MSSSSATNSTEDTSEKDSSTGFLLILQNATDNLRSNQNYKRPAFESLKNSDILNKFHSILINFVNKMDLELLCLFS